MAKVFEIVILTEGLNEYANSFLNSIDKKYKILDINIIVTILIKIVLYNHLNPSLLLLNID